MLSFAENLFVLGKGPSSPAASRIALNVTVLDSHPDTLAGHEGWQQYRLQTTLSIVFPNGNDLSLNSPVEMSFRKEPEDINRWRLSEWHELLGSAASMRRDPRPKAPKSDAGSSWGTLFNIYR